MTLIIICSILIGAQFDHILVAVLIAILLILIREYRQLYLFSQWLSYHQLARTPDYEHNDIWGQLYREVYLIRRRSSRRKRRLGEILERYRASAAALPDIVVALRTDFSISWFNRVAGDSLGLRRRDLGQRIDNLVRYPDFTRYLQGGDFNKSLTLELVGIPSTTLSLQLIPYANEQYLLVARDISQMKHTESIRKDFVANASHELRTPLTVLTGYLEVLSDRFQDDTTLAPVLRQMEIQADRMNCLIRDLLTISHLETLQSGAKDHPVDIPAMIRQIASDTEALSQHRHRLIDAGTIPDLWLTGEAQELHSAFFNLFSNAVQYTPEGGTISYRWRRCPDGAELTVSDTGIGIPAAHIPRLTERFYRVDPGRSSSVGGTGLGLSIVKHILRLHDAELLIESVPGQGSEFTCHFPENRLVQPQLTQQEEHGDNA